MTGMVDDLELDPSAMMKAAALGFSTATDLADWLVRVLGLPFREAHHVTGRLVAIAEQRGVDLKELDLADMQRVHPGITADAIKLLDVEKSVASRRSFGGTAPANVAREARAWLKALKD
jgi:argininosuccinate lyase